MAKYLIIVLVFIGANVQAQTFEVEQIEQLFRPRVRFDSKYIFDSKFVDTSSIYNQKEAGVVFTFPIQTKLNAELKLDLSSMKIKDVLKNSIRVKASQIMGMFRVNTRQIYAGFDSLPQKNLINASAGLLGVRLTKKYRVMFYSANVSIAEQDKTIGKAAPRASGLIGQLHPKGLRKNFFYGMAVTYSDGLFLPGLFFGGSQPIGKKFIFNYTLPVQLNLQYKDDKKTLITVGVSADGYRTGINYTTKRVNLNYTSVVAYSSLRYKFSRELLMRVEGGYVLYHNVRYSDMPHYRTNFNLAPGPYVQVGFSVLFGQTLWEKLATGFLKN